MVVLLLITSSLSRNGARILDMISATNKHSEYALPRCMISNGFLPPGEALINKKGGLLNKRPSATRLFLCWNFRPDLWLRLVII